MIKTSKQLEFIIEKIQEHKYNIKKRVSLITFFIILFVLVKFSNDKNFILYIGLPITLLAWLVDTIDDIRIQKYNLILNQIKNNCYDKKAINDEFCSNKIVAKIFEINSYNFRMLYFYYCISWILILTWSII